MTKAFTVSALILAAAYCAAVAAATFGNISFRLPSFSSVIGGHVALGVLAFAFRDYTRQSQSDACPALTRSPRASGRAAVHLLSLSNPTLHAN